MSEPITADRHDRSAVRADEGGAIGVIRRKGRAFDMRSVMSGGEIAGRVIGAAILLLPIMNAEEPYRSNKIAHM
ncbi:MAG: hypothetical protein FJX45_11225 [Alphaproteobacteria bacterium]|nr:hypothetical protein [Alphaproteobacteria bacterium]MBM3651653.1 hypothetical protein [Alphaproteobacteria bacterium]